jgi:hypothetical protein
MSNNLMIYEVAGLLAGGNAQDVNEAFSLCQRLVELQRQRQQAEEAEKLIKRRLDTLFPQLGIESLGVDEDHYVSRYMGVNSRLDEGKLVERGVDPDVLAACKTKTPFVAFTVRKRQRVAPQ